MYESPEFIVFDEEEIEKIRNCFCAVMTNCGPPFSQCGNR